MSVLARIFSRKIITTVPKQEDASKPKVNLGRCRIEDFDKGPVLGTGSFGRVYLLHKRGGDQVFAVKALCKSMIIRQKQIEHVTAEKEILEKIDFPFIVNLIGSSQDESHIYLLMEYVCGGEFFSYLRHMGKLDENTARFYAAQVLLTFEYLHKMGIVYRDLKPENLLLDEKGNIKVADFGFAKKIDQRTYTLCGYAPFYDNDPLGTYQKILSGKLEFPAHFSRSAKDLIRKLLTADLSKRLGCLKSGVDEIKDHSWFANMKWDNVLKRRESAPIRPKIAAPDDTSNFEDYSNIAQEEKEGIILTPEEQDIFRKF